VMHGGAAVAVPDLGPPDVLDRPASVAGFRRRKEPVRFDQGGPVPFALVAQLAARVRPGPRQRDRDGVPWPRRGLSVSAWPTRPVPPRRSCLGYWQACW